MTKQSGPHVEKMTSFPPFLAEFFVFYIERSEWPLKGQAFEYSLNPLRFGCLWWLDGFFPTFFCQIQRRLHTQGASHFLFVHSLFLSSRHSLGCARQDVNQRKTYLGIGIFLIIQISVIISLRIEKQPHSLQRSESQNVLRRHLFKMDDEAKKSSLHVNNFVFQ